MSQRSYRRDLFRFKDLAQSICREVCLLIEESDDDLSFSSEELKFKDLIESISWEVNYLIQGPDDALSLEELKCFTGGFHHSFTPPAARDSAPALSGKALDEDGSLPSQRASATNSADARMGVSIREANSFGKRQASRTESHDFRLTHPACNTSAVPGPSNHVDQRDDETLSRLTLQTQLTTRNCLSNSIMKMPKKTIAKIISQMATEE
ncbi:hypothetical protein EYF80_016425 [Liparis tanakae]|uniref:Uncharacterized protein n=1 Tax=Liparis tanakae TaxID=230148 RepID=A0A4Z2I7L1_9TELE|nr:hypothetical protein EYF80_016425 [Liparis tanakae]